MLGLVWWLITSIYPNMDHILRDKINNLRQGKSNIERTLEINSVADTTNFLLTKCSFWFNLSFKFCLQVRQLFGHACHIVLAQLWAGCFAHNLFYGPEGSLTEQNYSWVKFTVMGLSPFKLRHRKLTLWNGRKELNSSITLVLGAIKPVPASLYPGALYISSLISLPG